MRFPTVNVIGIVYNCDQWIAKTLSPWAEIIKKYPSVRLSIVHGVTPDMYKITGSVDSLDKTQEQLKYNLDQICDKFDVNKNIFYQERRTPQEENELRNLALHQIRDWEEGDYIFIFDPRDEFYSLEKFTQCIEFAESEKFIDCFKVSFKNYVKLKDKTYYYHGFAPPRIWRIKQSSKHGLQFKEFSYDNDANYFDSKNCETAIIPQSKLATMVVPNVEIEHYSWVGTPEQLKQKVDYQMRHFKGICSYKWDDEQGLLINQDFHNKYNVPLPVLYPVENII